jgi:hypothetical protein
MPAGTLPACRLPEVFVRSPDVPKQRRLTMRPPRYRFPDSVRTTTRSIASRMIQTGEVASTPEELDAWITRNPEEHASLKGGGYGTEFDAQDLFPLLQAMIGHQQQSTAQPAPSLPGRSPLLWGGGIVLLLLILFLLLAATTGAGP